MLHTAQDGSRKRRAGSHKLERLPNVDSRGGAAAGVAVGRVCGQGWRLRCEPSAAVKEGRSAHASRVETDYCRHWHALELRDLRARRDVMEVLLVCSTSESSSRNCFLESIVRSLCHLITSSAIRCDNKSGQCCGSHMCSAATRVSSTRDRACAKR